MENANFTCNTLKIYRVILRWRCTKLNRNVLIIYKIEIEIIEIEIYRNAYCSKQ